MKAVSGYNKRYCIEPICRPNMKHGDCIFCGSWTDSREMRIDRETLKRKYYMVCHRCQFGDSTEYLRDKEEQQELRKKRTFQDWAKVSDPLRPERLKGEVMPEQHDGKARQTIRTFMESEFDVAMANDSDAATLNSAIRSLGLGSAVYVEIRSNSPILRKVAA